MNFKPARRPDRLAAVLVVVSFAVAGWKTLAWPPATGFAPTARQLPLLPTAGGGAMPATASPKVLPAAQLSPDGRFRFDAQFVSSSPGQAVHAASVVELKDGRLQAVWFSGSREGAGDVSIQTALMDPVSQRWSAERTLFDRKHIQQGLWRYVKKLGNPVIARAPDGSLRLWMVTVSLGGWAGSAITWARSDDEGATWSAPRRLVTSPFLNISTLVKGAPVAFQDGTLGLPVYHEFVTKLGEVLRLDTQGRVVDKSRIPGSQTSLQPVVLVESADKAQVYMRSGNAKAVMASTTADGGKSWSPAFATGWPNPDSALAGVVTGTGQQWLALNPAPRDRETLTLLQTGVGATFDQARPWVVESSPTPGTRLSPVDYALLLGGELKDMGASDAQTRDYVAGAQRQLCGAEACAQEFSYPFLLQSRDGYIHLVYTWHRTRIKHIRFDPLQTVPVPSAVTAATSNAGSNHALAH